METADSGNYDHNELGHHKESTKFREIFTVFGEGMSSKLITNGFKQGEHDVNISRNFVDT